MTVELKKGYIIDSYYDKNTRSYITTLKDNEGNQIRDAYYSGNMTDRNSDIQHIKEFFYKYMDSKTGIIKDEDIIDDKVVEESLKSKIIGTKKKTKKSKLPALSTLSPIMPDGAAGIATFNSGVGLSEEYLNREELINRISKMGFKYKFDKYSDAALYRIYQERLRELERRKKVKREKKQRVDELENKRVNSQDSYFENGIEFESEDAAREYFGESMNTFEDTARVRDITAWAFSKDLDLDTAIKVVEKQMKKEGSIIPNNLRSIVYACWDDLSDNYDNEYFGESMNKFEKRSLEYQIEDEILYIFKKYEAGKPYYGLNGGVKIFDDCIQVTFMLDSYQERFLKGHLSEIKKALAIYGDGPVKQTSFRHSQLTHGNREITYTIPLKNDSEINESMNNKFYLNDIHRAWHLNEGWMSNELYDKWGDDPESLRIEEVEPGYFTVFSHDGNSTYYFGNSKEDCIDWCEDNGEKYFIYNEIHESKQPNHKNILNENLKSKRNEVKHNFRTITEGLKYFERKEFSENCKDAELELLYEGVKNNLDQEDIKKLGNFLKKADSADDVATFIKGLLSEDINELTEARKPKYVDSLFGKHVKDAMDRGELTYDNIEEWDRNYNGGEDPIPALNTRELMDFYYMRPDYFEESLNESYIEERWIDISDEPDADPYALEAYGLKVIKKDTNKDGTLYRFEGRKADIERAMGDGYFMSFEYDADEGHSSDLEKSWGKLADELIQELHKAGFELDDSVSQPVRDNAIGGKHLQVINHSLMFPIDETEGDEDEAVRLMIDDLKDVTYILDKFEEDNDVHLTFNFGPNKDMVITGGIDIR